MNEQSTDLTVLVTGANGFLGSELVKQLLDINNIDVIAVTSQKERLASKFTNKQNLTISNKNEWVDRFDKNKKIDILLNCAFPRTSNPKELAEGILFTENLIKDAIDVNVGAIINISSQSVYSQKAKATVDEKSSVIPESFYGMTKYACERLVAALCEKSRTAYSNIRLASLTGFDLEVRMTNRFVKAALRGEPIVVYGGNQKVSYLDVRDAASAIVAMIKMDPVKWNDIYNLGNHQSFTILELVEQVERVAKDYSIEKVDVTIKEGNDDFNNVIESNLFYKEFNWIPNYDMPLMVKELFNYYSK